MEILINPRQTRILLKESTHNNIGDNIKSMYDQVKEILKNSGSQIGENLTFLVTWGASIGGMIRPLNAFIEKKFPELNEMEISLILTGIIANYYFDNSELIKKIIKKINDEGLGKVFSNVFLKAEELKKAFFSFIESLGKLTHKMTNIMSYAFIIPIIPMIYESIQNGIINERDSIEIAERILSFGLLTVSGIALKTLILKIIKRFNSE